MLNLYIIVNDILDLIEYEAIRKAIRIVQEITPEIKVYADENMVRTILRNLVSNAIKFTNEKGSITLKALEKDSAVEISVVDTGVGISSKNIELLFNVETNI